MIGPVAPAQLLDFIRPDMDVIVPILAGEPESLIDALEAANEGLSGVRIHRMDPYKERAYIKGEFGTRLRHVDYYLGPGSRQAYWEGRCELMPNHFSDIPRLLRESTNLGVVLAGASMPDKHDYFSLGTNADYCAALIGEAPFFLEANRQMPRTQGQNQIHISQVLGWTEVDRPLYERVSKADDPRHTAIAGFIAERVPNGACVQFGIGNIPNKVAEALSGHRDLGVHTEVLSDGVMALVESGAANGLRKKHHRSKHVTTFCLGSRKLYDWLDDNPAVLLLPVDQTNDPRLIGGEPNMISVNGTTEVDLMGQAASETMAGKYWSSSGGQGDFARGAMHSDGGQAFLCTNSTTSSGRSRIRTQLTPGSVVTTLKNTVDHVVTEHGVAKLRGKTLQERAKALIAIAAPEHRDELRHEAKANGILH